MEWNTSGLVAGYRVWPFISPGEIKLEVEGSIHWRYITFEAHETADGDSQIGLTFIVWIFTQGDLELQGLIFTRAVNGQGDLVTR
jgi:hypothetical protein